MSHYEIEYNDPRYPFFERAARDFVMREFNLIPTVLFLQLANHTSREKVLELRDSPRRYCSECTCNDVERGDALKDNPNDFHWKCAECERTDESERCGWKELQPAPPAYGWPGTHGVCYWFQSHEKLLHIAPEHGFYVYEPRDFNGYVLAIDGGGYDLFQKLWIPLYLALELKCHELEKGWEKVSDQKRAQDDRTQ